MAAKFNESAKHRCELNFVQVAMGTKNAYVLIYGVRIAGTADSLEKAHAFLEQHSAQIGEELENARLPELTTKLPTNGF